MSEGDATISFKSGYAVVIDGIHGHYLFVMTDTASGPALTRQFNGGQSSHRISSRELKIT